MVVPLFPNSSALGEILTDWDFLDVVTIKESQLQGYLSPPSQTLFIQSQPIHSRETFSAKSKGLQKRGPLLRQAWSVLPAKALTTTWWNRFCRKPGCITKAINRKRRGTAYHQIRLSCICVALVGSVMN